MKWPDFTVLGLMHWFQTVRGKIEKTKKASNRSFEAFCYYRWAYLGRWDLNVFINFV